MDDYRISEPYIYVSKKPMNPLRFGYKIICLLGNKAQPNNMYKEVVAGKVK